jgi:predicted DsbA family dithiol-disulfide isomerase
VRRALRIEVRFDFICPWCLIGLRNLQTAIAGLRAEAPGVELELAWRGVQLLPEAPAAGWPFVEFYLRRLGGAAPMRARQQLVMTAAEAAGVRIDYARIDIMPNTADAHRLLRHAAEQTSAEQCAALLERLLCAYFEDGADLADGALLRRHALACGIDPAPLAALALGADVPFDAAGDEPVTSVPAFRFGRALALRGAQPAPVLLAALRTALAADGGAPS